MENIQECSDSVIHERIGERVRTWRLEVNMTQRKLAENTNLSLITIQQLEYGNGVKLETLVRVLRILGRLDALHPFFDTIPVSPIKMAEMERIYKKNERKRASNKRASKGER